MDVPSYRRLFPKSPHHVWLAVLTLGLGFAAGNVLGLLVGGAAYALGWIYLPDTPLFRAWADRRTQSARAAVTMADGEEFRKRRDAMVASLSAPRRTRLGELVAVCRDVEQSHTAAGLAPTDAPDDPRIRKLDELVWTYLRLLAFEQSLETFLEVERKEEVPKLLREAGQEAIDAERSAADVVAKGGGPMLEARQRLAASCRERVEVLEKRQRRIEQAKENLAVASAELLRLVQQVKLIRADAVATRNADGLSMRIDSTVEQLGETTRWLTQIEDFRDVVGDGPPPGVRVAAGIAPAPPSPVPAAQRVEPRIERAREEER
ncbi:MAG: hypothetical protein K8T90_04565 [Planctomycetes bacterium]|nr:hypothetical protein [Planctomycetota bacterium]